MIYPIHRFRAFADLTTTEENALQGLADRSVVHRRGATFQREGDPVQGFHLHIQGWVISSIMLRSGDRLVQKVHLPGDMLSTPSMVQDRSADTLTAITETVTAFVPYTRFGELFVKVPRLAALFTVAVQMERLSLMDNLATNSNASSSQRLARLLLDLHKRLGAIGKVEDDGFHLPLTQGMLAELLGISPVHFNRTIRSFDRNGWISRQGQRLRILDLAALHDLSPLSPRVPIFEPNWLPARVDQPFYPAEKAEQESV